MDIRGYIWIKTLRKDPAVMPWYRHHANGQMVMTTFEREIEKNPIY